MCTQQIFAFKLILSVYTATANSKGSYTAELAHCLLLAIVHMSVCTVHGLKINNSAKYHDGGVH